MLGSILTSRNKVNVENVLEGGSLNLSKGESDAIAHSLTQAGGGDSGSMMGHASGKIDAQIFADIQGAFAHSTQTVFYIMAGVFAVAYVVAHIWMVKGKMVEVFDDPTDDAPAATGTVSPPPRD